MKNSEFLFNRKNLKKVMKVLGEATNVELYAAGMGQGPVPKKIKSILVKGGR